MRVTHEIRNPLNGAAVNLEVVRSRAGRPGVDAGSLAPFAEAASAELGRAIGLVEALLALARPAPNPVDLGVLLQPLLVVYRAVAEAGGGSVDLDTPSGEAALADVDGDAARLLLTALLDVAVAGAASVRCSLGTLDRGPTVRVARDGALIEVPEAVRSAARDAGLALAEAPDGVTLILPAPRRGRSDTKA
jgi:hypothetical protein